MITQLDVERLRTLVAKTEEGDLRASLVKALRLFHLHMGKVGPHQTVILNLLEESSTPMSAAQLSLAGDLSAAVVVDSLARLQARGIVCVSMGGTSKNAPPRYALMDPFKD